MGARYLVTKVGTALNTSKDSLTITAPAARSLKIWSIVIAGQGTASANNEILVSRSTVGTIPTAVTPQPLNADYAAASFTVASLWTTDPTIGVTLRRISVNSNGGVTPVQFLPGNEIDVPGAGQISFRSAVGTGIVTIEVIVEQI